MQAIVAIPGSDRASVVDHPQPESVPAGYILCESVEIGICGTDREILLSKSPHVPRGESRLILGHECLGRVVEVGAGVTDYQAGDWVVPVVRRPLENPPDPRRAQRPDMLPMGQFTERGIFFEDGFATKYWLDRPEFVVDVEPELSDVAVLAEPFAVAEKGINEAEIVQKSRLEHLDGHYEPRVLVTGMGPIAFAAALIARVRNWPVTMAGRDQPDTFRATLAAEFDIDFRQLDDMNLADVDVEEAGFDLLLECTGSDEIAAEYGSWVRSCGAIVWLGASRIPKPRNHNVERMMCEAIFRNHVILGTVNSAMRDFIDALRHLKDLKARFPAATKKLFTERLSAEESLVLYNSRVKQSVKTLVEF